MITALGANPIVRQAARVADRFKLDPVAVLDDGGDEWPHLVRAACMRVLDADDAKRAEKERAAARQAAPRKRR